MLERIKVTKKDRAIARLIEEALNLEDVSSMNNHDKSFFLLGALMNDLKISVTRKD